VDDKSIFPPLEPAWKEFRKKISQDPEEKPRHRGRMEPALFLLGLAVELNRTGRPGIPPGDAVALCRDFLEQGILSESGIEKTVEPDKLFQSAAGMFGDRMFESEGALAFLALHRWLWRRMEVAETSGGVSPKKDLGSYMTPVEIADILLDSIMTLGESGIQRSAAESDGRPVLLDPAVGNGIFLLRAAGAPPGFLGCSARDAVSRLYGVDIDPDAVLVSRISLYIQAGERPGLASVLRGNIVLADFLLDEPFPGTRFDYIIGNPPFLDGRRLSRSELQYFRERFRTAAGKINTAVLFLEQSLKKGGVISLLLPEPVLKNSRYASVRELLLKSAVVSDISLFGFGRFRGAGVSTVGITCRPNAGKTSDRSSILVRTFHGTREKEKHRVRQKHFEFFDESPFLVGAGETEISLLRAIESRCGRLGDLCRIRDGISTGFSPFPDLLLGERQGDSFVSRSGDRKPFDQTIHVPVIDGSEFDRYSTVRWKGRHIRYDKSLEKEPAPPRGRSFNCQLRERWIFETTPRILTRQTSDRIRATIIKKPYFTRNSIHNILPANLYAPLTIEYILGILNSAPLNYYYRLRFQETGAMMPQVHIAHLKKLPIPVKGISGKDIKKVTDLVRACLSGGDFRAHDRIDRLAARLMGVPEGWGRKQ